MRIAVVAPARAINPLVEARTRAFAAVAFPQVDVVFHPQCFMSEGHFAGSDAARADAFVSVANDPSFDVVWCARGGYGSNRVLDLALPQLTSAAHAKIYVGYSDVGFLLGGLYARGIGRSVHGPMPVDIGRRGGDKVVARTLGWLTQRESGQASRWVEPGLGDAPAAAFNLAILTTMLGTPWVPDLTDHVLLIEEVSEPLYRIDRMMFQLTNAPQLAGIAGIRLGSVADVQENTPAFGVEPEAIVEGWCRRRGIPYLGRARIGHDADNHVVPFGIA